MVQIEWEKNADKNDIHVEFCLAVANSHDTIHA